MEASFRKVLLDYKLRAAKGSLPWSLTEAQFHTLIQLPCTYCGAAPSNRRRNCTYQGLDRLKNQEGYKLDNVVPCCAICNQIKSDLLSFEEMQAAMNAILKLRNGIG